MADSKPAALATAAAVPFPTIVERVRPHAKLIGLLALGHFAVDLTQGSLPAVLPFLKSAHGLSDAEVATIVLATNLTASLLQPLFGYLADQTMRRWILPTSVVVAGAGMALTGLAPGYTSLVLLVVVMGLGVAAWHPEGYRTATGVAGDRKATALSYFSLGGNVGIALGPLVATFLVTTWALQGTLALAVPLGLLFLATRGTLAIVMLAVFGAVLTASFSLSVVLAQAYLPRHTGMASGLIVGFAFGTGGLGVAALGWVADRHGLPAALTVSALIPLASFVAAHFLPAPRDR